MTTATERAQRAVDTSEITQLVLTERESRDLGRWRRMRECFGDGALIRISWIRGDADAFVKGSEDMARRGVLAKHALRPVLVRVNGDRAIASMNAVIEIPTTVDGVEAMLQSHARMLYPVQRQAGTWKLMGFNGVYVRDELAAVIPGQVLHVDPAALAGFRRSYRFLSYTLTRNGYVVDDGLPGDDQPETVRALEDELFGWAGVEP